MKAIIITQEIKDKCARYGLYKTTPVGTIVTSMPKQFYVTEPVSGDYRTRTDLHEQDGWGDVIPVNPGLNQKLGQIIPIEGSPDFTYEVIDLTPEEIAQNIESAAEQEKEEFIQLKAKEKIETELQEITDDNVALENQAGYPLWSSFPLGFEFTQDFKVQSLDENVELKLYRIIQPHDKQIVNEPKLAPALWAKIEFSGGVEVWSQPIGGDGKYPYLNPDTGNPYIVTHNGVCWENNFEDGLNVWEPGVFGWTEIPCP